MGHRPVDKAFIFQMVFYIFGRIYRNISSQRSPSSNRAHSMLKQIHKPVLKDIIWLLSKCRDPKWAEHHEPWADDIIPDRFISFDDG